ncbi:MAG: DUF4857 domain-containing protein [Alistipes sp.]|nr:DUF4857 domain-containing protein [Alistipes sp.]
MLRISKIFFWAIVAVLLAWQLPWLYNFFFAKSTKSPFTLYSSVIGDFAVIDFDEKDIIYTDLAGNIYTEDEFDTVLPTFYCRQLMADGRFPDTICGVKVNPHQVQVENFHARYSPSDINKPKIGLYALLESMSGRVDLQMPDDVFRITNEGIEFIDMESNTINEQKSQRFTEMMLRKGFKFPATTLSGNPTDRKEYDEGYVILDAEHKLFHLKMTKGRPYCRAIELPEGMTAKHLFITEFSSRRMLALISDTENGLWVVKRPTYEVVKTGVPSYNPETESIIIMGNMFDWTVGISDRESDRYYALDANDFSLLKSHTYDTPDSSIVGLTFTSYNDEFVRPRFE